MKPVMGDSKLTIPVVETTDLKSKKSCLKRPVAVGILSCLAFVVIVAIVITAIYVGGRLTKDQDKEAWITIHSVDGSSSKERFTVSEVEEEVYVPGFYHAVFDFTRSLVVVTDIREEPGMCLVTTFNRTQVPTPKDLKKIIDKGTVYETANTETVGMSLMVTGDKIDHKVLSQKSQTMCDGKTAVWAVPHCSSDHGRAKRLKWKVTIDLGFLKIEFGNY